MANEQKRLVLPTNVRPTHYNLILSPDLENFTFKGTEVINLDIKENTNEITLNSVELKFQSAFIENLSLKTVSRQDATEISYNDDKQIVTLTFKHEIPAGTKAALHLEFTGVLRVQMDGFYRSSYLDESGNKKYLATTQFEPTDARRAFPCWDEPAIKATFDITLIVPSELTALSNMNAISEKSLDDGKKEVKFATTPIMSTYLIAFVVGDFAYVEKKTSRLKNGGNPVLIRVYATRGNENSGQFALSVAADSLEYFAEIFGITYPLPKLDMVAIHDFETGAMENWGLITYRTAAILFDPKKSDARFKQRIAYTVSHELAHQWFGNLVTMEWWDHLWLNEGFATWVGYLAVDKIFPEWDIWTQFLSEGFQKGLQLDSLKSSHPIEVPVMDPSEINQIFDAISYFKGASVIRMLSNHLGVDVFLSGIRKYLNRYKYGNASTGDLWKALSEESGLDVGGFMDGWTKVVGYPVVFVDEPSQNKIHLRQTRFLSTGVASPEEDTAIWWVPLGIDFGGTGVVDEVKTKILTTKEATIDLPLKSTDDFFQLNTNETGVYRVAYTPERLKKLGQALEKGLLSTSDRIGLVADIGALSMSGYIKTSNLLSFMKNFANEDKYIVWCELRSRLSDLLQAWSEQPDEIYDGILALRRELISKEVSTLSWDYSPNDDYLTTMFRTFVIDFAGKSGYPEVVKEARRRFDLFTKHNDESALHPNIRGTVYGIVLINGGGEEEFNAIIDLYRKTTTPDQRVMILVNMAFVQKPELIQRALEFSISNEVKDQDFIFPLQGFEANRKAKKATWKFIQKNWDGIHQKYENSHTILGHVIKYATQSFASEEDIKDVESFFKDRKNSEDFSRPLQQSLESIKVNSNWIKRDSKDVELWLRENKYLQ